MSFWSGLKVFGKGIEHVVGYLGSPVGQKNVVAFENLAVAFGAPPVLVDLTNNWMKRIYTVEALAAAAAHSGVSGPDKAALVKQTVTPLVLQYAQTEGLSPRTAAQIQAANDALILFMNAMTKPAPVSANTGIVPPSVTP